MISEEVELLARSPEYLILLHLEHVEADGLREWPALPSGDNVALLHVEARGAMHGDVAVALLKAVVLLNVVQVVPPDHDCPLHLRGDAHALMTFPRMLTFPVKGHFLSMYLPSFASLGVWKERPTFR